MRMGYVSLGETQGGRTWLYSVDRSEPVTAQVTTVDSYEPYGSMATGASFQRGRCYQGARRRIDWQARLWMAAVIGGTAMVWVSIVALASLFVALVVLPAVFGTR
jgi:hypothetical protein